MCETDALKHLGVYIIASPRQNTSIPYVGFSTNSTN